MWTRAQLKERAKAVIRPNYWRAVLVALIITLFAGVANNSCEAPSLLVNLRNFTDINDSDESWDDESRDGSEDFDDPDFGEQTSPEDIPDTFSRDFDRDLRRDFGAVDGFIAVFLGMIVFIVLVICALAILADIFLIKPIEVGGKRFFYRNLSTKADVKEIAWAFDRSYLNVVKIQFFRTLYTVLWTLLLFIPGTVKSYEYMMIPYLLAEYPDMPKEDAFAISRFMMDGHKWDAFVLDLSFILWDLLNAITFGIVGLFWLNPYREQTKVAFYDAIKAEKRPFDAPQS